MRRPSPAMIVALLSLFVALTGVGVAATGGNFILGQPNTASSTTSLSAPLAGGSALQLSNTDQTPGSTALSLKAASGHAPFTVNSGAKVVNLNADLLDGLDSSHFLTPAGTAANALKLGGFAAAHFLPAGAVVRVTPVVVHSIPSLFDAVNVATIGPFRFIGRCSNDGHIGLFIKSSDDVSSYMTAAGFGAPGMTANTEYTLADTHSAIAAIHGVAITGDPQSGDSHAYVFDLFMGMGLPAFGDNTCAFGGTFVVAGA